MIRQEVDSAAIRLPGGVQVGSGVSEALGAFWATLEQHRRRETAPSLAKNTSVAMQQKPCTERTRHLFSAPIAASILAARKLAQWDGRLSPALESAIADAISLADRIMAKIDSRWPSMNAKKPNA
jgi:hypothetical protein